MRVVLRALATGKYILLALIVAVLMLVLVTTTSSYTEAQDQGNQQTSQASAGGSNVSSGAIPVAQQQDAREYWTPERMNNAKPLTMSVSGSPDDPGGAPSQPQGQAVKIPPAGPSNSTTSGPATTAIQPTATTSNGYTYPFPFTRHEVFDPGAASYSAFPYRTNGKVFFTKATGGNFVCSGTVVNTQNSTGAGNLSTVWTAGHCVSDGAGRFHLNWVFVPAFRDGVAPFGTWSARTLNTKSEWHSFSNFKQDVGAAVVNPLSGVLLQNRVGAQGISFNQPYPQHWHSFGYPQASPFNGNRQHVCAASYARQDNPSIRTGPLTIGIGCDMTGGSSGGGWLLRFGGGGGFVNSVNSYKYNTEPLSIYGPYHGNDALSLFNFARTQ